MPNNYPCLPLPKTVFCRFPCRTNSSATNAATSSRNPWFVRNAAQESARIARVKGIFFAISVKTAKSQENCAHSFAKHDNLAKRLQELLIKCRHYQHGCQKILRVSQIYQHEREDCEYSKLKCDSKQCEELSKDGEIKHLSTCGFFVMKCEFCFKEMRLKEVFFEIFRFFAEFLRFLRNPSTIVSSG